MKAIQFYTNLTETLKENFAKINMNTMFLDSQKEFDEDSDLWLLQHIKTATLLGRSLFIYFFSLYTENAIVITPAIYVGQYTKDHKIHKSNRFHCSLWANISIK